MASPSPHFVVLPFLAQGHLIPMIDISRLLAKRGVVVTIITTPLNAKRFEGIIARAIDSGLQIRVVQLHFPCVEAGLPQGCENFDHLISMASAGQFFEATRMLQKPVEDLFEGLNPPPACLLSDMCYPWTTLVAEKFSVPKLVFHGMCCFSLFCTHVLQTSRVFDTVSSEIEPFAVPGMPDFVELTKNQVPAFVNMNIPSGQKDVRKEIKEGELSAYGVVVNTFEAMEEKYVKEYARAMGKKVWCIGPVSLCNNNNLDKADRGNKASIDEHHCLKWLDHWEQGSVIYVCLGSLTRLATSQMIELGLGLEASNRPFVWVIRYEIVEFEKWILVEGFGERIKERGLLIRGWAPQVLILSHRAIGGFLTHCGWNSTMEGICAGVPMLAWPMFAEQFVNEKLVVHVLKTAVSIGAKIQISIGKEEEIGILVRREDVKMGVDKVMEENEEGEERKRRARKFGEMAKWAIEEGGSSHNSLTMLIQDVVEKSNQLRKHG